MADVGLVILALILVIGGAMQCVTAYEFIYSSRTNRILGAIWFVLGILFFMNAI